MSFNHLKKLDVGSDRTAWMTLHELSGRPKLLLAPAAEVNRPFFNALLKRTKRNRRQLTAGDLSPELMIEARQEDRELYPAYVLKGWEGVVDDTGKPVEFNAQNAIDFCAALPDWLFDRVRNWASTMDNFADSGPDAVALAKN